MDGRQHTARSACCRALKTESLPMVKSVWWANERMHNNKSCTDCSTETPKYSLTLTLLLLLWRVRQALPIWGDKEVPKRWGIPLDSVSKGIRLSLVVVDNHLLTGAPLKGGCRSRCPQLTYCQPLSNNRCWRCRQTVKLQSVLRLCSGFYRSKDPTNSI